MENLGISYDRPCKVENYYAAPAVDDDMVESAIPRRFKSPLLKILLINIVSFINLPLLVVFLVAIGYLFDLRLLSKMPLWINICVWVDIIACLFMFAFSTKLLYWLVVQRKTQLPSFLEKFIFCIAAFKTLSFGVIYILFALASLYMSPVHVVVYSILYIVLSF